MLPQHDPYPTQDFSGGRACADSIEKQISHGRPIDAPQVCYDDSKIGPPRLQLSVRHE
jgi:hypothetical protein